MSLGTMIFLHVKRRQLAILRYLCTQFIGVKLDLAWPGNILIRSRH